MRAGPDGKLPYKGFLDCGAQSIKREGVLGLWVGWTTFVVRVSPHAIIALLVNDYLNTTYGKNKSF